MGRVISNSAGWLPLLLVCVVFTVAAAFIVKAGRLLEPWPIVLAAGRAVLQLALVSAVITGVLASLGLTGGFLLLMTVVATATSAARTGVGVRGAWVGLAIVAGVIPALVLLVGSGLLPTTGTALVPMGGILIGGGMTATTLAVRRVLDTLKQRHGEYEAALALGFTEPVAIRELVRKPAADALLPVLDQTRTVGLVTLPGAFVGMLLAGSPVWLAGALQLVVLLGLLVVESLAIVIVVELVAHGRVGALDQQAR
jgi:UDP-glucose/iron transport system permease protein